MIPVARDDGGGGPAAALPRPPPPPPPPLPCSEPRARIRSRRTNPWRPTAAATTFSPPLHDAVRAQAAAGDRGGRTSSSSSYSPVGFCGSNQPRDRQGASNRMLRGTRWLECYFSTSRLFYVYQGGCKQVRYDSFQQHGVYEERVRRAAATASHLWLCMSLVFFGC